MNQPRLQRLYEVTARDSSGELVHHWITTSCITAMTLAHEWLEAYRIGWEAYRIGLFSSVVHCSDMPEIQTIK